MSNDELRAVRRVGLGRGLDAVIAGAEEESPPAHVQPLPGTDVRLSIAEGPEGTTVTVSDGRGRVSAVAAEWSAEGTRDAAIRAVAGLAGIAVRGLFVSPAVMGGSAVVTVLIEGVDGARHVGAAAVVGSDAFAAVEATVAAVGLGSQ